MLKLYCNYDCKKEKSGKFNRKLNYGTYDKEQTKIMYVFSKDFHFSKWPNQI